MRCDCCNKILSDYETTLRHAITGSFLNTCVKCLDGLNIPTIGREELTKQEKPETKEEDWWEEGLDG